MEKSNKNCTDCKYFLRHYIWITNHFTPINCGNCTKHIGKMFYKRFPLDNACENWESGETLKTEQETKIKDTLIKMSERIKDIAQYFETDN